MTIGDLKNALQALRRDSFVVFDFGFLAPTCIRPWHGNQADAALGYALAGHHAKTAGTLLALLDKRMSGFADSAELHIDNAGEATATELTCVTYNNNQVVLHTRNAAVQHGEILTAETHPTVEIKKIGDATSIKVYA